MAYSSDDRGYLVSNQAFASGCEGISMPVNNNSGLVTDTVNVSSGIQGTYVYNPSATEVDVLHITNNYNAQVDFQIMSAVNIKTIKLVNNSTGTVKFRAGGNFPYPTITYCNVDDPSSSTIFENTVTLNTNSSSCVPSAGDCYTTGSTLADLNVSAANTYKMV